MKHCIKRNLFIITILVVSLFLVSCATVPLTGRRQIAFIPANTALSMSYQQYNQFIKENTLSDNLDQVERVKRVGEKIKKAVEKYMRENGLASRLKNYRWEFNLIKKDQANAWAMPGGKVVVYTGMLPIAKDDNGLAVIIAHEVAHVIARHGIERMSQGLIASFGGLALSAALEDYPDQTKRLWLTVFGVGAQYGVLLPYSRLHEKEADHLGLIFMAMAGYDPHGAITFWQRMAEHKGDKIAFEFLSTHPSNKQRIANIKKQIPEAMQYYR
ncbi:MAG: M48 family metallopeptidase [Candidatus Omnitrophica bacterium]|nr:M48 family metallopeptidase [Candidatus Omnitrophota bacterium]